MDCYAEYTKAAKDLVGAKEFFAESSGAGGDAEMKEMAREEVRKTRLGVRVKDEKLRVVIAPCLMSYRVLSCLVLSHHTLSCLVLSCLVLSGPFLTYLVLS